MNKNDRYKCTVDAKLDNGIWSVTTNTKDTLVIERLGNNEIFCCYGMDKNKFVIKKNNYANNRINKDGTRTLSIHMFKQLDEDSFLLYPFRYGVPFFFKLIKSEV